MACLRENPQLSQTALLFYQDPYLVEEIIKEKGLTGEEKARFRQEHAGPIWETFRAWAANTILDVPKDRQPNLQGAELPASQL